MCYSVGDCAVSQPHSVGSSLPSSITSNHSSSLVFGELKGYNNITMDSSNITVLPVEPPDFMALARIEAAAFAKDEIGLQMFGPSSEASIRYRASTMGDSKGPGEAVKFSKAVITNAAGEEEIVGFASWRIYSPANVPEDTKDEDNKMIVPPVPCPELYIDVIVKGDLLMNKSCGEEGYFSEFLFISLGLDTIILKSSIAR